MINQQFDNTISVLPEASPMDASAGGALYYDAWDYQNEMLSSLSTAPPSYPNVIGTGVATEARAGERTFTPINSSGVAFDLIYAFYLCTGVTLTSLPNAVSCTIQVVGTKYGTGETVAQELVCNITGIGTTFVFTEFGYF